MAFVATITNNELQEPILSRFDRIDHMLKQLEGVRTWNSCRTSKSWSTSTPSSGTLTSEGRPSLDVPHNILEKYCRPLDDVIREIETKGTLMDRLSHVEDKVFKICTQLEAELEAEKRKSESHESSPVSSPRKKMGLRQLVRSCVKGSHEKVAE